MLTLRQVRLYIYGSVQTAANATTDGLGLVCIHSFPFEQMSWLLPWRFEASAAQEALQDAVVGIVDNSIWSLYIAMVVR
jgi:hypothetical protein